jgi:tRNA(fMet)-specific endonuclease VapC
MSFLLDTNTCSAQIKQRGGLSHRFVQHSGRLYVPTIVLGELYSWAYLRPSPAKLLAIIERDILREAIVLDFDRKCADRYGQLRGHLVKAGATVNAVDLMIAVVALVHDLTLVTNNTKHFRAIPDLRIVDWV